MIEQTKKRLKILLTGLTAGVLYAFVSMLIVTHFHQNVSITYIFILPIILGSIPVLLSTKEQLKAYKIYLFLPWLITFTFFVLSFVTGFEGMICLVVIIAPFLLLGTLGTFIFRLIKLRDEKKETKLYISLFLPLLALVIETNFKVVDQIYTVSNSIDINSDKNKVWGNVKNVKNIQSEEIKMHFIHVIGLPKPINGELDREGVGGTRYITWEKGIKFQETITNWTVNEFCYDVNVDPTSIPAKTLDEHVMIGGRYFDVLSGSYKIDQISSTKNRVTLTCRYRVTTNLNFYSKLWADFIISDFNEMILEVIKKRSETN